MSNIRRFPDRKDSSEAASDRAAPLELFTHPPRYPTVQSVGGAVVGQVIVLPTSPDQSRQHAAITPTKT